MHTKNIYVVIWRLTTIIKQFLLSIAFSGATQAAPLDKTQWKKPDPSNPEHVVIVSWHRSLLDGDFKAYINNSPKSRREVNYLWSRYRFERRRRNAIPKEIVIHLQERSINLIEYNVAGCGPWPGFEQPIRLVAGIMLTIENGKWKASASDFAPPWNNLVRVCPEAH